MFDPVSTSAKTNLMNGGSSRGAGLGILRDEDGSLFEEDEEIEAKPSTAVGVVLLDEDNGEGCHSGLDGSKKGRSSTSGAEG